RSTAGSPGKGTGAPGSVSEAVMSGGLEVRAQAGEEAQPVFVAEDRLGGALRVRHQAEDVARLAVDAGDVRDRAVDVDRGIAVDLTVGPAVAEGDPLLAFEALERRRVALVAPLG